MKYLGRKTRDEDIKIPEDGSGNHRRVIVSSTQPSSPDTDDVWIDTN